MPDGMDSIISAAFRRVIGWDPACDVKPRTEPPPPRRMLCDEERAAIVEQARIGRPYKQIAEEFGCSYPTVSAIAVANGIRRKKAQRRPPNA